MRFSIRIITSLVVFNELPAAVLTFTNTTPWSSSGTKLVLVVFIKKANSTTEATRSVHTIHLRLIKNNTPFLYLSIIASKAALNALRKRAAKLFFSVPSSLIYGFKNKAHSAGLKVSALTAEIPTATAIVKPN